MARHPLAGKPAPAEILVNVPRLVSHYYAVPPDPTVPENLEDAIRAVPKDYVQASLALGADRWQTLVRVVLPAAASGILAAVMLGMGRAIGETMTVLMATGNAVAMPQLMVVLV